MKTCFIAKLYCYFAIVPTSPKSFHYFHVICSFFAPFLLGGILAILHVLIGHALVYSYSRPVSSYNAANQPSSRSTPAGHHNFSPYELRTGNF
jgi:hypothetical protein